MAGREALFDHRRWPRWFLVLWVALCLAGTAKAGLNQDWWRFGLFLLGGCVFAPSALWALLRRS